MDNGQRLMVNGHQEPRVLTSESSGQVAPNGHPVSGQTCPEDGCQAPEFQLNHY